MTNKFNPDTRVDVIENGEVRKGIIKKVYNEFEIAIVEFEDGNVEKVHFSKLGLLQEEKVQDNRDPKEPVEKSEITITPDEFREIASNLVAKEVMKMGKDGGILGLTFTIFLAKLHRALFLDEGDND